jgi:hypothetical protein
MSISKIVKNGMEYIVEIFFDGKGKKRIYLTEKVINPNLPLLESKKRHQSSFKRLHELFECNGGVFADILQCYACDPVTHDWLVPESKYKLHQIVMMNDGSRFESGVRFCKIAAEQDQDGNYRLDKSNELIHVSSIREAATAYVSLEREIVPYDQIHTLEDVNAALEKYTETMSVHNLMYKKAELNEQKGKKGGDCNVTQCQEPNAVMWNNGTNAWYCQSCAEKINNSCKYESFHPLCISMNDKDWADTAKMIDSGYSEMISDVPRMTGIFGQIVTHRRSAPKPNAKCPCGSGKSFKKCCGRNV